MDEEPDFLELDSVEEEFNILKKEDLIFNKCFNKEFDNIQTNKIKKSLKID